MTLFGIGVSQRACYQVQIIIVEYQSVEQKWLIAGCIGIKIEQIDFQTKVLSALSVGNIGLVHSPPSDFLKIFI